MSSHENKLVRPFTSQDNPERSQENLEIQPDRIVFDVVEILLRVQMHRLITATVDLPPACHPWRNRKASVLPGLVGLDKQGQFGAGSNEAHRPSQYVEELGTLVQTEATQVISHPCHARIRLRLMK